MCDCVFISLPPVHVVQLLSPPLRVDVLDDGLHIFTRFLDEKRKIKYLS